MKKSRVPARACGVLQFWPALHTQGDLPVGWGFWEGKYLIKRKLTLLLISMANDWPGPMGLLDFPRQRCHSPVTSSAPVCAVGQLVALCIRGPGGIIP